MCDEAFLPPSARVAVIDVYVINLDRAPDRMGRMDDALRYFELAYERIAAVDGQALSEAERQDAVDLSPGTVSPNAGQIGCFLSHKHAWEKIAEGAAEYGLILEDDVVFAKNFADVLNDAQLLAGHPDMVRLEGWPEKAWIGPRSQRLGGGYRRYLLNWDTCGTCAYIISKTCATFLLEAAPRYTRAVDLMLFDQVSPLYDKIDAWALVPAPCYQYLHLHGESDVAYLDSSITGPLKARAATVKSALPVRLWREAVRSLQRLKLLLQGKRRVAVGLHPVGALELPEGRSHRT